MKVICPRKALQQFRAECRKKFPCEHMAALFGRRSDEGNLLITRIASIRHEGTPEAINIHRRDVWRSKAAALRGDDDWLGTIHSHCSSETDPCCWHLSVADIKSAQEYGEAICGIVYVDNGGKRSSVSWYDPTPLPEVIYD